MRQRKGEQDADYKERRAAYDAARRHDSSCRCDRCVTNDTNQIHEATKNDLARRNGGRPGKGFSVRSRTTDAEGNVKSITEVRRGRKPDKVARILPSQLARTSTLFDAEGRVAAQWVIERPADKERFQLWKDIAAEFIRGIPRVAPTPSPAIMATDLLVEYPVGDHHMGMLAWKHEGTDSYDLDIGETMLEKAFTYLSGVAPAAPIGLIEFLGDLFHYDSPVPVTPTGKNNVDSDGRFPKMVRATVRAVRRSIEIALARHAKVHVIIEIGNHDLYSSVFLMELLANVYENEPRITIDTGPRHYHYFRHGRNLIGTHHGHGSKPEGLPGIMASDRPQDWGEVQHRFWRTGHVHQKRHWDFPGCSVESARILPPPDAWAHQKGYRPHRSMEAIVLHSRFGEVGRYPVTPQILEEMS